MSVPGIVRNSLDGEQVAAQVSLGGEDGLYVTPSRTLVYRADGLLSDESVEEYPHTAERISISEGRRKSSISLDYGIDGEDSFSVPSGQLYEALHPVLAGVLNAAEVTAPDETVKQTYQFSELTLVITSDRVVKHVGNAVWDQDFEEYPFADVTALDVEEGSVSSQIIVESGGRPQRIKTPSDQTREVRERIENALLDYHDAPSYEAFASARAADSDADEGSDDAEDGDRSASENDPLSSEGVTPIDADPPELDEDGAIVEDEAMAGEQSASDSTVASGGTTEQAATGEPASADHADGEAAQSATHSARSEPSAPADSASQQSDAGQSESESEGFAESGFEPASSSMTTDEVEAQLEALTETVRRQNKLLAEQQQTIDQLIEELRRGR